MLAEFEHCRVERASRTRLAIPGNDASAAPSLGLAKRHETLEIFRRLGFDIDAIEIDAHVGPRGCGKTTLLCRIDGFSAFDEGVIGVDHERVTPPGLPSCAIRFGVHLCMKRHS